MQALDRGWGEGSPLQNKSLVTVCGLHRGRQSIGGRGTAVRGRDGAVAVVAAGPREGQRGLMGRARPTRNGGDSGVGAGESKMPLGRPVVPFRVVTAGGGAPLI